MCFPSRVLIQKYPFELNYIYQQGSILWRTQVVEWVCVMQVCVLYGEPAEYVDDKRYTHYYVHCGIIYNSQNVKAI